ncbi:hypothetical protein VR7878_03984 [Vibrio ruber DSM 16370]|uniref:Uncharacterized protein n=1 Tax=Vibrio ruber (strain DSM 16370 / JCM 11486 / BCRC 17186 / CECT 7878 / LMG 23124 / VR1) TaxID=1123498 RepID=A0A1R4LU18_VIBR1|nr:hypothetical protein [Vibrio ruber]SJN60080.1 hypothetical protein VR7878_03984 [Vibrio ruber DSM 16370]
MTENNSSRLDLPHTARLYLIDLIAYAKQEDLNELREVLVYLNNLITFDEQENPQR